jgi:Thiamine pyrophosphate enzyme, N-terminal TPP binding domain/Recombinase/Recombinase zinc beta ribbon domain
VSDRFWPIAEPAQDDYEQLREIVLQGGELGEILAARRFARRGLAGLISWPSAEPAYLGSVTGARRPAWCGIPSPSGKPQWGTSTLDRLLRNEAYMGTVYYNRNERIQGGTRGRMTRQRERPREEWIAIPVPTIIDRDTFDRVSHITHENWRLNPRGVAPNAYLLRGLIKCGHCHVSCNCHTSVGRKATRVRYYTCRNHDVLRARSEDRLCPERSIRADALDEYAFAQVRQALLDPQQLLAGERAVLSGAPDENELIAIQLKRLNTAIDAKQGERDRLLDAYQAGLLDLDELTRRTSALTARHSQLIQEKETLTTHSVELATQNRLRRRLAGFSERIAASLDDLDFDGRQRLLRLVVEHVRVSGWRVEIHLKIPPPTNQPTTTRPSTGHPGPAGRNPVRPAPGHCQPMCACVPFMRVPGDGINELLGALRRDQDRLRFVQTRDEDITAFMACGHAKFIGQAGVCMATSGPGAIHLLNGLYDAKLDDQPVVAIVGQTFVRAIGGDFSRRSSCCSSTATSPPRSASRSTPTRGLTSSRRR